MQPTSPSSAPLSAHAARRSHLATAAIVIAWSTVAPLATIAAARVIAHDAAFPLIAINSFTPWIYLPAWGALTLALANRQRVLAVVATALVALHLAWSLPGAVVAAPLARDAQLAPSLRVATANLLASNASTNATVRALAEAQLDLLVVEELTPGWAAALDASALGDELTTRFVVPRDDCFGIGIYTRHPLLTRATIDLEGVPLLRATLALHGRTLTVFAVHTLPPRSMAYARIWDRQMALLAQLVAQERGAVLVLGDLNATAQARNYQRLVAGRLRGAHEDRGRGLATTWPNGTFPAPPIRLDHVLVSPELAVRSVRELLANGSDHAPVVAELALLRGRAVVPSAQLGAQVQRAQHIGDDVVGVLDADGEAHQ